MAKWLKNEFWNGYSWYERIYLLIMVMLQIVTYIVHPDTPIGIACGISGVICVVLTAKGKISSYIFNFVQMITYMIICWNASLYLEFAEQLFYFGACIYGVFAWKKHLVTNADGSKQVISKKFTVWHWIVVIVATITVTILLGAVGEKIGSTLSYLDATTVVLSIMAQLLMVWRYREQWVIWIAIDVISLVMFIILGQWSMVAMYIAWTVNAIYGWYNWSKLCKDAKNEELTYTVI